MCDSKAMKKYIIVNSDSDEDARNERKLRKIPVSYKPRPADFSSTAAYKHSPAQNKTLLKKQYSGQEAADLYSKAPRNLTPQVEKEPIAENIHPHVKTRDEILHWIMTSKWPRHSLNGAKSPSEPLPTPTQAVSLKHNKPVIKQKTHLNAKAARCELSDVSMEPSNSNLKVEKFTPILMSRTQDGHFIEKPKQENPVLSDLNYNRYLSYEEAYKDRLRRSLIQDNQTYKDCRDKDKRRILKVRSPQKLEDYDSSSSVLTANYIRSVNDKSQINKIKNNNPRKKIMEEYEYLIAQEPTANIHNSADPIFNSTAIEQNNEKIKPIIKEEPFARAPEQNIKMISDPSTDNTRKSSRIEKLQNNKLQQLHKTSYEECKAINQALFKSSQESTSSIENNCNNISNSFFSTKMPRRPLKRYHNESSFTDDGISSNSSHKKCTQSYKVVHQETISIIQIMAEESG